MKKAIRLIMVVSYIGAWSFYFFMGDDYDQKYHEFSCEIIKTEGAFKRWNKKIQKLSLVFQEWERFPFMQEKCAREKLLYLGKDEVVYHLPKRSPAPL